MGHAGILTVLNLFNYSVEPNNNAVKTKDSIQYQDAEAVASLVQTALAQDNLSGLSAVLKNFAQSLDAHGCILWQAEVGSGLESNPPNGFLFVLAQWFEDGLGSTMHNMPVRSSATGAAVLSQKTINVQNVWSDDRVFKDDSFLRQASIKTMCSVPINFPDTTRGAVNLYRNTTNSFGEGELLKAEQLALLVPGLYQTIRDKVSLRVIQTVDNILHAAELKAREEPLSKKAVRGILGSICSLVSDAFRSVETTIFLEDRLAAAGVFELVATTWQRDFGKQLYESGLHQGITGWVLKNAKPVRIFDLAHFERDREAIRREYPEITWRDSTTIETAALRSLNLNDRRNLPPLSFMAAPIVMGDKVLGVIRCAVASREPSYFADRELSLLALVSARIGQYWHNWLGRREVLQENRSWRDLIESIGELNSFVQSELTKQQPNEHRIFAEALRVTSSVIEGAQIMDIRLLDPETRELYFAETHGQLWSEGDQQEIVERKSRRFPITDGPPKSAGAQVFNTGRVYLIPDTLKDPYYSETFSSSGGMIVAPIKVKDEVLGVLDIRTIGKADFPRHAGVVAELLGQQLGLYRYLAATIRNLRKAQADLSDNIAALKTFQTNQTKTFEDLKHQLYGPITQAHARIQNLLRYEFRNIEMALKDEDIVESLAMSLLAIRGLCAKAKQVAESTGLFARLGLGKGIPTSPKRLQPEALVKMIIEDSVDTTSMIDPNRHVRIQVARETFDFIHFSIFEVDHELLEQAIMNLLDNAAKYSFSNTTVHISAGLTRTGRLRITVSNQGLPIRAADVSQCVLRGWRSKQALLASGEGSGIGLWLVDNIMKAHAGDLVITPTTAEGWTEVSLIFAQS